VPAGIIPGAGAYSCLSLGTRWAFGTKGWILFTDPNVVCDNIRWEITFNGTFDMDCVVDSFGNSTCVQRDNSFCIPPILFEYVDTVGLPEVAST
jgi:hypothetical protein